MATAIVDHLLKFAKEKLLPLVEAEIRLLHGLHKEIEAVQEELVSIRKYLVEAEIEADKDEDIKEKVKKVRVMYKLEDIVDEYHLLRQQQAANANYDSHDDDTSSNCPKLLMEGIWRCFEGAVQFVVQLKPKRDIASRIVETNKEIQKLKGGSESYQVGESSKSEQQQHQEEEEDPRRWFRYTDESDFVGLEGPMEEIIELLDLQKQVCKKRLFVAVTGVPGVGKTTLVQEIYNDEEVKKHFKLPAWVTISQSYKPEEVLKSICRQFIKVDPNESLVLQTVLELQDMMSIVDQVRNYLQHNGMSYIVVLDDVWDNELLSCINAALPSNSNGSRILMTTRKVDIASYWAGILAGNVYNHKPLSKEDAWVLFCIKVFNNDHCTEQALEKLSRNILGKSAQLPLAIVAIAGLLSTKGKSLTEWSRVGDSLGPQFRDGPSYASTKKIMMYSYHDLPYELKPCFLYFGMFLEDFEMDADRLVRTWVAESFIKSQRGYTLEELAEKYLNELIQRGLVQTTISMNDNVMEYYRVVKVHDILHEIILSKLEELDFCQVLSKNDTTTENVLFRRVSIISDISNDTISKIVDNGCNCSIRSILLYGGKSFPDSLVRSLMKESRCLRILDLQGCQINDHVLEEVGNLANLRLLSGKLGSNIIPECICRLLNLETLQIKGVHNNTRVKLPREINKLCKLRHLVTDIEFEFPDGVLESLTELQSLEGVNGSQASLLDELKNLHQLRKLKIFRLKREYGQLFCSALEGMAELQSLDVGTEWLYEGGKIDMDLEHLSSPPKKLKRIFLFGYLGRRLPNWIGMLSSLVSFSMMYFIVDEDPLQLLQKLPNLEMLQLLISGVQRLDFGSSGFENLRHLVIRSAQEEWLKSISGTLPRLRSIKVASIKILSGEMPADQDISSMEMPLVELPSHLRRVTLQVERTSVYNRIGQSS